MQEREHPKNGSATQERLVLPITSDAELPVFLHDCERIGLGFGWEWFAGAGPTPKHRPFRDCSGTAMADGAEVIGIIVVVGFVVGLCACYYLCSGPSSNPIFSKERDNDTIDIHVESG